MAATINDEFMGVILAAGKGTRMHRFLSSYPKPLLPVGGKPLITHQIEEIAAVGVKRIAIVIGRLGHEIVSHLGDGSQLGVELEYVEQHETLGIAHALFRLEAHIDRPFFLFLGDIFFKFEKDVGLMSMVERFSSDHLTRAVLAVKREANMEAIRRNFIVLTDDDDNDRVTRVIEKPRHPQTELKGCGIYLFHPAVFDAVRRTPRTAMRNEYENTDSIQIFLEDGNRVEAAEVIQEDVNVSYPQDLLDVNQRFLDGIDETNWLGEAVTVHPEACLERCVVGTEAGINTPSRLCECLILPKVQVDRVEKLSRTILTPHGPIYV